MRFRTILGMMMFMIVLAGCSSDPKNSQEAWTDSLNNGENTKWSQIGQRRIYFGHQSVGMNIIQGLTEIDDQSELLTLDIVDFGPKPILSEITASASDYAGRDKGFFAHGGVGKNGDPVSKLQDFEKQISDGFNGNLDIALFKFCYKDFNDRTDITAVFQEYKNMVSRLNKKYPELKVIHITAPLRNPRDNWKNNLKLFLRSKSFQEYENNLARAVYNKILNETYQPESPVFDLALIESTRPDGDREGFIKNERFYPVIYKGYTYDGGHLTPLGRRVVAIGMIDEIAKL